MRPTRFALALAAGLVISGSAIAHSELHSAEWCVDGVIHYIGTFSFTPLELRTEFEQRLANRRQCLEETGADPNSGDDTCGIFDPPYEMAVAMARGACGAVNAPVPTMNSPVTAFISDPPTFNDPNHHALFNLDSGISGMCGYCEYYGPPTPMPPIRQN